jgi:hypothetical protein
VNNAFSKAAIWVVIALVLFTVFRQFDTRQGRSGDVPYSRPRAAGSKASKSTAAPSGRVPATARR